LELRVAFALLGGVRQQFSIGGRRLIPALLSCVACSHPNATRASAQSRLQIAVGSSIPEDTDPLLAAQFLPALK
jgi:hypothetical protein